MERRPGKISLNGELRSSEGYLLGRVIPPELTGVSTKISPDIPCHLIKNEPVSGMEKR